MVPRATCNARTHPSFGCVRREEPDRILLVHDDYASVALLPNEQLNVRGLESEVVLGHGDNGCLREAALQLMDVIDNDDEVLFRLLGVDLNSASELY